MSGHTVVAKALAVLCHLIIARILVPEDFGLIAVASSIAAVVSTIRTGGVQQILVQRFGEFDLFASAGFAISLLYGTVGSVILLACGSFVGDIYGDPRIAQLVVILAADPILAALSVIPQSKLQGEMRFRELALLRIVSTIVQYSVAISLVQMGFGVAGFVVAIPLASVVRAVVAWSTARPTIDFRRLFVGWAPLFANGICVLGGAIAFAIGQNADRVTAGLVYSIDSVGIYCFALAISMQVSSLLITNLQSGLLPAFSQIQDALRRRRAAMKSIRVLSILASPICCLQAVAAEPLFRLLFPERWSPAIPLFQVLSIAMIFRLLSPIAGVLIQSQGRFRTYLTMHSISAAVMLFIAYVGGVLGGPMGTATGVLVHAVAHFLVFSTAALGSEIWRWQNFRHSVGVATSLSVAVALGAFSIELVGSSTTAHSLLALLLLALVGPIGYIVTCRFTAPDGFAETLGLMRPVVPQRIGRFLSRLQTTLPRGTH